MIAWGANNHGQLGNNQKFQGTGTPVEVKLPEPFSFDAIDSRTPIQVKPMQVACGGSNSALLVKESDSATHHLFVWGSHKDGKLGLGKESDSLMPERVNITNPILIQSGCDHSVVLDGKLNIYY